MNGKLNALRSIAKGESLSLFPYFDSLSSFQQILKDFILYFKDLRSFRR